MKYFVNLIMTGALICAICFTSCKDDEGDGGDTKVQSVTLTQSTVYIFEGSTTNIAATVAPNVAAQEITWTTDNPSIVSVIDREKIDGISTSSITGLSIGSTTVTATSVSDPDKKATIQVTVGHHVEKVTVNIDSITFVLGAEETVTVEAAVIPANAIQTLTWTSSNTNVATVTNGVIRAVEPGVATITAASTDDPTKKATIEVETVALVNKLIHIASKFGNGLTVRWVNLGGDLVEFFYTNETGQPTSRIEVITTQSSYIPDFGSAPLSYRTLYYARGGTDTLRAPLINFTGSTYDLTNYIRSSVAENVIKAADFDIGGEGIGFHDLDNNNALVSYRRDIGDTRSDAVYVERGTAIGNLQVGAWYNYTVAVEDAGNYEIDFRVSVNGGSAKCRIEVDGEKTEDYSLINNANWEDWRYYFDFYRLTPPKFYLNAGKHVIKFYVVSTGFNFNGLRLVYKP